MVRLGVNVDHVATLREVRREREPDPVWAAAVCELAGAGNVTVHLREDRRHIQDRDLEILRRTVRSRLNLEMACTPEMIKIACRVKPDQVTLVPEKRQELTTEGGLDAAAAAKPLAAAVKRLSATGIETGLFIDADASQVEASKKCGARFIEFHTGAFAGALEGAAQDEELDRIIQASVLARRLGMSVHAGHGLHYLNIHRILKVPHLEEVNIGHAIISRALFSGLAQAVREMLALIQRHTG